VQFHEVALKTMPVTDHFMLFQCWT